MQIAPSRPWCARHRRRETEAATATTVAPAAVLAEKIDSLGHPQLDELLAKQRGQIAFRREDVS